MRVRIDIKRKVNRNESYEEKNRGLAYMPRFVTLFSYMRGRIGSDLVL